MGTAIRYAALALALAGLAGCDDGATATPDDDMGMGGQGGTGGMGGQVGAGGAGAGGEGGAGAAGGQGGAGAGGEGGAGAGGEGGAGAGGEGGMGAGGEGGMGAGGEGGMGAGGEGGMGAGGEGGMGGEGGAPPPAMGDVFSGRITQLAISGNPAGDGCRDVTGDGIADNSLAIAAMFANGPLQESLDDGELNLMPTSIGLAAPGNAGMFDLALLTGTPENGAYTVQMASLNDDGSPRVVFGGAESMGGDMQAGPGDFPIAVPLGGMELDLNIGDTVVEGQISIDANGLSIQQGVISGVIPNAELVAALEQTEFAFAAGLLFPDVNGVGNSICLTFTSVGATLNGFPVE